jgi:hypothetical protein
LSELSVILSDSKLNPECHACQGVELDSLSSSNLFWCLTNPPAWPKLGSF